MKTTTRLLASLSLLLAVGCGSKSPAPTAAAPSAAPARVSRLASINDLGCDDAPPPPVAEPDQSGGECTAP